MLSKAESRAFSRSVSLSLFALTARPVPLRGAEPDGPRATPIEPPGSANQTLSSLAYETGTLGRWYQPTNSVLIDAGSRSAALAGLYHYTVKAANGKEGSDPSPATVDIGFHYVACTDGKPVDGDSDGLPDYFEDYDGDNGADAGETNPSLPDTDGDGLSDLLNLELGNNVLVSDPAQDYGNEQNTQWQPKVVAFGDTVVVAFWDSNRGVYGLQADGLGYTDPTNECRMAAYAVSVDGGSTFLDMDVPPKLESEYGDAGDPVLALDRSLGTFYFAATSERYFFNGIPLWRSTDNGTTFVRCPTIRTDLLSTDYPWIAVDDWPRDSGEPFHDIYAVIMSATHGGVSGKHDWLTVARNGNTEAVNWSDPVSVCPTADGNMPQIVVGRNHVAYVAWAGMQGTNELSLQFSTVSDRGTNVSSPHEIADIALTNMILRLFRSATSASDDWFEWGSIAMNGTVTLGTQFRITTGSFQPAFAGTLQDNWAEGHYDPVWPPGDEYEPQAKVNLQWWYTSWFPLPPTPPSSNWAVGDNCTWYTYRSRASEHNGAYATGEHVYVVWADNRSESQGTRYTGRKQTDIRLVRLPWPAQ